jgi:excinuclease ABC subunit B
MKATIDETDRRRDRQIEYNMEHGIIPKTVLKSKEEIMRATSMADAKKGDEIAVAYVENEAYSMAADPITQYLDKPALQKAIVQTEKEMYRAAKEMEYMEAARLRDDLEELKKRLKDLG